MELFDKQNSWYKGNLHTHTTISDGVKTPDECIRLYKGAGYSFIAITDHRIFTKGYIEDNFLLLNATEFDTTDYAMRRAYHITGIGIEEEVALDTSFTPQDIIDGINSKNGLAVIAHPYWSLMTHEDIMKLRNYHGIEIWNTVSETHSSRGDSTSYADVLASKGYLPLLLAVDDTHFYTTDVFGGYIMVNSRSLNSSEIIRNIKEGRFYCSQAPEIRQISIDNGTIKVETSPVSQISFVSDSFYCSNRICRNDGELISEGCYEVNASDSIVRIECTDINGKKAWSQLIQVGKYIG